MDRLFNFERTKVIFRFILLVVVVFSCQALFAQDTKVVFVIADGIPTDVIEEVNTPALDAIAKVGGYATDGGWRRNVKRSYHK